MVGTGPQDEMVEMDPQEDKEIGELLVCRVHLALKVPENVHVMNYNQHPLHKLDLSLLMWTSLHRLAARILGQVVHRLTLQYCFSNSFMHIPSQSPLP